MAFYDWQSRREKLNHDILCNQLLNEVVTLQQQPASDVCRLHLWPQHAESYRKLLNDAADALSAKRLLELPCFECWSQDYKDYFGMIFHAVFLLESGIDKKLDDVRFLFEAALQQTNIFMSVAPEKRTAEMVIDLQQKLSALSAGISSLPIPYIA
jgi:hypothetical protein